MDDDDIYDLQVALRTRNARVGTSPIEMLFQSHLWYRYERDGEPDDTETERDGEIPRRLIPTLSFTLYASHEDTLEADDVRALLRFFRPFLHSPASMVDLRDNLADEKPFLTRCHARAQHQRVLDVALALGPLDMHSLVLYEIVRRVLGVREDRMRLMTICTGAIDARRRVLAARAR